MHSPRARAASISLAIALAGSLGACGSGGGGGGSASLPPAPAADSIRVVGGPGNDYAETVGTYADGSFVVCGEFSDGAVFGRGESNETTLSGDGFFVARYGTDGHLTWVRTIGAPAGSWMNGLVALPDGGVVLSGMFFGEALFAWGTPSQLGIDSQGVDCAFVARYDADGAFLWATPFRGAILGAALTLMPPGLVMVSGRIHGPVAFGEAPNAIPEDTGGSHQGYLAWLVLDDGVPKETFVLSATGYSAFGGVKVFDDGSAAYAVGFTGTLVWDMDPTDPLTFASAGGSDIALVRLLANGDKWGRRIGGPGDDWVDGFATTPSGDVVLTGPLPGSMTFDGAVADAVSISTPADFAQFLCRYDAAGQVWARTATESPAALRNPGVAANADGVLVLTTTFWGDTVVDPTGATPARLPAPPDGDGLLECWDATGHLIGLGRLGGAGYQQAGAAAARADGSFVVLGVVSGSVTYDPSGPHPMTGDGVGQDDFFVLDLMPPTP